MGKTNGYNLASGILEFETSKMADWKRLVRHQLAIADKAPHEDDWTAPVWKMLHSTHRDLRRMARTLAKLYIAETAELAELRRSNELLEKTSELQDATIKLLTKCILGTGTIAELATLTPRLEALECELKNEKVAPNFSKTPENGYVTIWIDLAPLPDLTQIVDRVNAALGVTGAASPAVQESEESE
jgi:hypothetical protein